MCLLFLTDSLPLKYLCKNGALILTDFDKFAIADELKTSIAFSKL
jgi:hypothetical protein